MNITLDKTVDCYEVIVAGGGPAGCTAAVAAARQGVKVLLIESSNCLGGMGTIGMVPSFAPFTDKEELVSRGIAEEIITEYKKRIGKKSDEWDWLPISYEDMKTVYDEIVTQSGANVIFNSNVCYVKTCKDKIDYIAVSNKAGLTAYKAKVFIDCTGDADIAAFSKVPLVYGDENGTVQPSSLCFAITGIDVDDMDYWRVHAGPKSVWKEKGDNPKYPLIDIDHFVINRIDRHTLGINAGHLDVRNIADVNEVSRNIIKGREIARQYLAALKEYMPETFKYAYLISTAAALGVRESRRIVGEYTLTVDDYLARRSFDDEIARNCYFIDCHAIGDDRDSSGHSRSVALTEYGAGESHGIPWRCLVPKGIDNLLVAGRTISTDRAVLASVRVMPVCMTLGEAAGVGAATAVKLGIGIHSVDANDIRKILKQNGAYII